MKVYIKVVVSREYKGLIISLRSELFDGINLIDGKGLYSLPVPVIHQYHK